MSSCICRRSGRQSYFLRVDGFGDVGIGTRPESKSGAVKFDRAAERLREAVDDVLASKAGGDSPDRKSVETIRSFAKVEARMIEWGLILPAKPKDRSLKALCETVADLLGDVGKYSLVGRKLCEFFGPDTDVTRITRTDAKRFKKWLEVEGNWQRKKRGPMAAASVVREIKFCVTIFGQAVEEELIAKNPFTKLFERGKAIQANPENKTMIDRDTVERILNATEDVELTRLLGLTRFGGMRISEAMSVCSDDIREDAIFVVGKGRRDRLVPLFRSLQPFVEDLDGPVITSNRTATDFRDGLKAVLSALEIEPWAKPFHDFKASRVTELLNCGASLNDVSEWVGTNPEVLRSHYIIPNVEGLSRGRSVDEAALALPLALRTGDAHEGTPSPNPGKSTSVVPSPPCATPIPVPSGSSARRRFATMRVGLNAADEMKWLVADFPEGALRGSAGNAEGP